MSAARSLAIGIDLGTTFSAIAYLDDFGRPVTLPNAEGDLITPSAVLFEENNVVVGKEAIKALATEADQVAECAKRELGAKAFPKQLNGRYYPPEVIQAWILNKLATDARRQLGDFRQVVITVPAYFDDVRRKATQDAGYMAGLEVLDIINEPTAAALVFGFNRGFLKPSGEAKKDLNILVYDLGGGTFDVTVMEIRGRAFTALATDGDVRLGGRDWDARLIDHVAEQFLHAHGIDPREDPNSLGRLMRECEDAKRTLSSRSKTSVPCDYRGFGLRVEITRHQYEAMTQDLLDRTRFTTQQTLVAAKMTWNDIDHVLLVGGSTRMPMVVQMLRDLSGQEPDASVSADEAVAHGAALRAGLILATARGEQGPFTVKNVNSHSLGVAASDPQTKRKRNAILIPRNTHLPVMAKRLFKTQRAGQKSVLVEIVEGESPSAVDCSQVGKCVTRDLPPDLPAHTPIEVTFLYKENNRLTVEVRIAGTEKELRYEIARENSLPSDALDTWRRIITRGRELKPNDARS